MPKLNLKTEWIDEQTVKVSWRDADRHELYRHRGDMIAIVAFVWFSFCFYNGLSSADLIWLPWGIGGVFAALIFFKMGFSRANEISITKDHFIAQGLRYKTENITRIAFGSRQSFTGSTPYKLHLDATEIRAWINDNTSFVISANSWDNLVNTQIRNEIDTALQAIRKPEIEPVKDAAISPPKQDNFGLPDY